jgi:hypothetical protein
MCAVASAPGRPASDNGRLCQGAGGHAGGGRCRRAFMLTILSVVATAHVGPPGYVQVLLNPRVASSFLHSTTFFVNTRERNIHE